MSRFVIREVKRGVKFDLRAGNGEIIATSEGYKAKASCLKGIESIRKNVVDAQIISEVE